MQLLLSFFRFWTLHQLLARC